MNGETPIVRFTSKVQKSPGCWIWIGARKPSGYGNFYMDRRYLGAHCASYLLFVGSIPAGMMVCHRCDNPSCVNPSHLFLGTALDNTSDMKQKGRAGGVSLGGDDHPIAKLRSEDISAIRTRRSSGEKLKAIASDYGVCEATIHYVCAKKTWKKIAYGGNAGVEFHESPQRGY